MEHLIVASRVVAEAEAPARHLPLTQLEYGGLAALFFIFMFLLTFAFRSLGHRHDPAAYVPPGGHGRPGHSEKAYGHGQRH